MLPDLFEDLAAFVYATRPLHKRACPVCDSELIVNVDGALICLECDTDEA